MKVMVFVKATPDTEAGFKNTEADRAAMAEMDKFNDELVKAGIRLDVGGLKPSSKGARVNFNGKKTSVTDGPFAEAKELVAGFWIWQVRSLDEAIEWAKRCPNPTAPNGVIEIRPFYEAEDFEE